jgi:ankyrin repeat protein
VNERQQKERNRELINSIIGGDVDDIQYAISRGAELTAADRMGRSVLSIAASQGERGSVDVLIAHGADVNTRLGKHGFSPLHSGAITCNLEACRSLLDAGADVAAKDKEGQTALHLLAHYSPNFRKELVDFLVERGADIHAADSKGNTPLHHAARHSNGAVAQAFLAHGADMEARNTKGEAPRDVFAKFQPYPGTLEAKTVFEAYDRHIHLQQVAQQSRPDDLDASEARVGSLADVDEVRARRGRGRAM